MNIKIPRGKHALAVSGGVDSVVLLDLLSNLSGAELVVAHFNHGTRNDSVEDEKLVAEAASRYGWPLEIGRVELGPKANEDAARRARYEFLEAARQKHKALKIITAHHQDDLIETALINLLRGTGRRGLSAIVNNPTVLRPLLNVSKPEILKYARQKNLKWHEDSTNQNTDYLRNYIRLKILPKLSSMQRADLIQNLDIINKLNSEIDSEVKSIDRQVRSKLEIDRQIYTLLPDKIADELLAYWLREEKLGEIDRYEVSRLKLALKTAKPNTTHSVKGSNRLEVNISTANFKITS
jgi:tRNA(Ile)-lysidine synthase